MTVGNVMKALICTLVDDAVHCLLNDDDVRPAEHVRSPFRGNTDRNTLGMTSGDRCLLVDCQLMADSESWRMVSALRFGSFEEFLVRLAEVSVDYYRLSLLEQRWCSDAVTSL